jgi:transcriptional regulator with XRE-family HTH domain
MTQLELAERLNYSDKAVSKWERGESVPDVVTLVQLAREFGVTLDQLVFTDGEPPAAKTDKPVKARVNRSVLQKLVSLLVWFVALVAYVALSSMNVPKTWLGFLYAVPANAIVLLCLRSAWGDFSRNHILVSLIVWGAVVSVYVTALVFGSINLWKLFLLGLLGQAATTLWCRLRTAPREEAKNG